MVKDDAGLWHLFYTGTMHDLQGMHQRLGHATSKDMHSWERVGDGLCLVGSFGVANGHPSRGIAKLADVRTLDVPAPPSRAAKRSDSFCATSRSSTSGAPPGVNGMIIRTGRDG